MKRLDILITEDEKKAWESQKEKDGYKSLSAWARDILNSRCEDKPIDTLQGRGEYDRNRTE